MIGFLSKAGRGRTWSDKQRYSNVWANKGYDLVFKFCACDCGHGHIRKDLDWTPPRPAPAPPPAGRPAQPEPPPPPALDKKKKKKEKTGLKPKLNFNPMNVTGSYFGSNRQKEDEQEAAAQAAAARLGQRLSSDKSAGSSPSPVQLIPGLSPPVVAPTAPVPQLPVQPEPRRAAEPDRAEKAKSVPAAADCLAGEDWVKVGASRRNSQQEIKRERTKQNSGEIGINCLFSFVKLFIYLRSGDEKRSEAAALPASIRVHDSDLLSLLQKPSPSFPNPALAFTALPMYQPPPERDYGFSRQNSSGEALSELGARPKLPPAPIAAPAPQLEEDDDIYHSDEDLSFEELDRNISALVGPASAGSESPRWASNSPATTADLDPDKEMTALWEQTAQFEKDQATHSNIASQEDFSSTKFEQKCVNKPFLPTIDVYVAPLRSWTRWRGTCRRPTRRRRVGRTRTGSGTAAPARLCSTVWSSTLSTG